MADGFILSVSLFFTWKFLVTANLRTMKTALTILLFAMAIANAIEFDSYLESKGRKILGISQTSLIKDLELQRLTWNAADKSQIRFARNISNEEFTFAGIDIVEAVFDFDEHKSLDKITVSVYNRGDCGQWPKQTFTRTLGKLEKRLAEITSVRQPEKSRKKIGNAMLQQLVWRRPGVDIAMRWLESKDDCEYITLLVDKHNEIQGVNDEIRTDIHSRSLLGNLHKDVNGDHWIDVPMVNQGDKGYCVAAVMERLMKYYNSSVDQHLMAQIMSTDPTVGTDIIAGIKAVDENKSKLRINLRYLFEDEQLKNTLELKELILAYNKQVPKGQKIDPSFVQSPTFTIEALLSALDKEAFIRSRVKRRPGLRKFTTIVRNNIDKGYPVVWAVIYFDERLARNGFHARLINGYNDKQNTIIYTDTWGAGHEKKVMPMEDAYAITHIMLLVYPR